jgi:hypothetical protein
MNKSLLFFGAVLLISSCKLFSPEWSNSFGEKSQPVKSEFKMKQQHFIFSELIDTNAIYISENEWVTSARNGSLVDSASVKYDYMVFSNSGIVFISALNEKLPKDNSELIAWGQYCLSQVEGNQIKLEFYNHNLRGFQFWYGTITKDGDIFFYKRRSRSRMASKGKLNYLYMKEKWEGGKINLEFPK